MKERHTKMKISYVNIDTIQFTGTFIVSSFTKPLLGIINGLLYLRNMNLCLVLPTISEMYIGQRFRFGAKHSVFCLLMELFLFQLFFVF